MPSRFRTVTATSRLSESKCPVYGLFKVGPVVTKFLQVACLPRFARRTCEASLMLESLDCGVSCVLGRLWGTTT
jgi:hypothetical protein